MAALARWCLRRRLVVILLWLAAFAGVAAAAGVTGSAYSNDYEVPGTESGQATPCSAKASPAGRRQRHHRLAHRRTRRRCAPRDVEQTMTRTPWTRSRDLPGVVGAVTSPYGSRTAARGQISEDGRTAYATVTFDQPADDLDRAQVQAVVDTAKARRRRRAPGRARRHRRRAHRGADAPTSPRSSASPSPPSSSSSPSARSPRAAAHRHRAGRRRHGVRGHRAARPRDDRRRLRPDARHAHRARRRHRLRAVHRHPAPQGPASRACRSTRPPRRAVATTGRAVVFAGATVCIALLGMLVLRLSFLNGVAIAASLTVVLTVAASVTLLPALLGAHRHAGAEPPRAPPAGRARTAARAAHRLRRPLVRLRRAPPQAARRRRRPPSCWSSRCPRSRLHLGTSDQGNNPATSTTRQAYDLLADGASGPASTAR